MRSNHSEWERGQTPTISRWFSVAFARLVFSAAMLQGIAFLGLLLLAVWLASSAEASQSERRQTQWELSVINGLLVFKQETTTDTGADIKPGSEDAAKQQNRTAEQQNEPMVLVSQHSQYNTVVSGMVARSTLVQRFKNPGEDWLQGRYQFPLPEDAAVDSLTMRIGQREIKGVIKEKRAAQAAFKQAQQNGQRASLVSQQRPNLFTTQLANIGPFEDIEIEIQFQQKVRIVDGEFRLRLPTTFIPRFGSDSEHESVFAPRNRPDIDIRLTLDAQAELAYLNSPHFPIRTEQSGGYRYAINLAQASIADRDFELLWRYQNQQPTVLHYREALPDGEYGLLMLLPGQESARMPLSREITLVVDTSSSMGGQAIEQAKKALLLAIDELTELDAFNIIEFNSAATSLWGSPRAVNATSKQAAKDFVTRLKADGGTNIYEAIDLALLTQHATQALQQIVFITDGAIGYENSILTEIQSRLGETRLFTVGIGAAPNSYFMVQAAQAGRGTYTYISSPQQIEQRMRELLKKLAQPALTDINLQSDVAMAFYPERIPDLYYGEPIVIAYQSPTAVTDVHFTGVLGEAAWQQTLTLDYLPDRPGVAKYWAQQKIQDLLAKQRFMAFDASSDTAPYQQKILQVALQHNLVSPYTSLIAVDLAENGRPNNTPLLAQMPSTALDSPRRFMLAGILLLMGLCLSVWHWRSEQSLRQSGATHV
ncbi:VIT domain-containing protein [Planctobacterium marinum]|uniref:VIT domain-containing protein n=1 Tax=Planctobacterium marinum TaxID=1631968 RepID=UPI001E3E24D3|nr:VIT domain-containing protein [Planctobacterium marinum]MCC2607252.1 VWA domain-containing protein [Planctobacterium marinum]